MLVLIVIIGTLNVCLGFGLAVYYGYGPPGLGGVFQALGRMPPATPDAAPQGVDRQETPSAAAAAEEVMQAVANATSETVADSPAEPLAEDGVLSDVQELAASAKTAMAAGTVQAHEQ